MTIIEAIDKIDASKPNTYEQVEKIRWLSNLEWTIKREIIDTHEGGEKIEFNGYTEDTPIETQLIVPAPYDELYIKWLEAQIDYANGEFNKFNASIAMYNTYLTSFANYYNRNHMPIKKTGIKYF